MFSFTWLRLLLSDDVDYEMHCTFSSFPSPAVSTLCELCRGLKSKQAHNGWATPAPRNSRSDGPRATTSGVGPVGVMPLGRSLSRSVRSSSWMGMKYTRLVSPIETAAWVIPFSQVVERRRPHFSSAQSCSRLNHDLSPPDLELDHVNVATD